MTIARLSRESDLNFRLFSIAGVSVEPAERVGAVAEGQRSGGPPRPLLLRPLLEQRREHGTCV